MELYSSHFEDIQRRLRQLNPSEADSFKGVTSEEIAELENYAGGKLPLAYRKFLEILGQSAGRLFQGSHALLSQKWSLRFRAFAEKMLANVGAERSLPESAFVFLMHQGYQFLYFRLDEGENPPVYIITDSEPEPKLLVDCFTNLVDQFVADLEDVATGKPVR